MGFKEIKSGQGRCITVGTVVLQEMGFQIIPVLQRVAIEEELSFFNVLEATDFSITEEVFNLLQENITLEFQEVRKCFSEVW